MQDVIARFMAIAGRSAARPLRPDLSGEDWLRRGALFVMAAWFIVVVVLPLYALLIKSFEDRAGEFVGLANYARYFDTPALFHSIYNSFFVAIVSTIICITLAFVYGYALTRTCMPGRPVFRAIALLPMLAPSLLSAISFIYLFGNQGFFRGLLFGHTIYGPIGIIMGEVFWTFPHALLIITTSLAMADARLYESARTLGAGPVRTFFTVTLPGCKYGLISACFVVFTLVITDFGVPKVIGGQYNVLATDVYRQVVGQLNFSMGAVVGMILLMPAVAAFAVDRLVQRRQVAQLSARAVAMEPEPARARDWTLFAVCAVVALCILVVIGMAAWASVIRFWPYNLSFTLNHYRFDLMDGGGWASYYNSLKMAAWTALFGTVIVFSGAYLTEKTQGFGRFRGFVHLMAMIPMAVPGLVLGIAYIFFFNHPSNPFHFIYQSMAILVICTIVHFYTVSHLTAVTALKQMDPEFESVSASLKVPFYRTFLRVTVPVCTPAILGISIYLFVNAMTTVSAVVFLYGPQTTLASVAVLNMDDQGDIAPAAAMAMMIVYTSAAVKLLHWLLTRGIEVRSQAWRRR